MDSARRNWCRGYRNLIIWQNAIGFYAAVCERFEKFPWVLRRVASNQIAAADSIHRNIAEGYCRRSTREYLYFLGVAIGSLGECTSGFHACRHANQLSEDEFHRLDTLAYELENGLINLVAALKKKQDQMQQADANSVHEDSPEYGHNADPDSLPNDEWLNKATTKE